MARLANRDLQLIAPERFTTGRAVEVTLAVPAGFARSLQGELAKAGLGQTAKSLTLTAALSGDGFAVAPELRQSRQVSSGAPTVFRWAVTAEPGFHGPLRADLGAELPGPGRRTLALGSVERTAKVGSMAARAVGIIALALIAALVTALVAGRRLGPGRPPAD